MKFLGLITIMVIALSCHPTPATYTVPTGYKPCTSDLDCNRGGHEYCGFVGVDTYAVCRQ